MFSTMARTPNGQPPMHSLPQSHQRLGRKTTDSAVDLVRTSRYRLRRNRNTARLSTWLVWSLVAPAPWSLMARLALIPWSLVAHPNI
jgi:hypothetical protein